MDLEDINPTIRELEQQIVAYEFHNARILPLLEQENLTAELLLIQVLLPPNS